MRGGTVGIITENANPAGKRRLMGERRIMNKQIFLSIMAALAVIAVVRLITLVAAPLAKPLAWALIIGIATLPHHARLHRKFPRHPDLSAGVMVLAITVCLILPVAAVILMVVQSAAQWYTEGEGLALAFSTTGALTFSRFPLAREIIDLGEKFGIDLSGAGARTVAGVSDYLLYLARNTALNLGELLFTLGVALFSLFFVYRDGEKVVSAAIVRFAPDREQARHYCAEIRATTTAVTVGTIFTCLVQGATAGVGYFAAGLPAPVLCGALTALAALVPVVGTGCIWAPLAAVVALNGAYFKAALLATWCLVLVGLADNAIRPLAIGAKSNIPVPAIVLGAIGGLFALGMLGLILGPVLFALLGTVWHDVTCGEQERPDPADPLNRTSRNQIGRG